MFYILSSTGLIQNFGIALAVGASTFALIFYYMAIKDGTVDPSEKRFMHAVYFVLRIGMVLIILSQLLFTGIFLALGQLLFLFDPLFWFIWTLLFVIIINAILMHFHKMPMWLGPALAGGSWYAFAIVNSFAPATQASYPELLIGYVLLILFVLGLLRGIRRNYIEGKPFF